MEGSETQDDYYLEFNTRIPKVRPTDLEVNDYLNLETQSGSRYVFRVTRKDDVDGVIIKFISGSNALRGAHGKIENPIIETNNILDFEGGTTTTLVGIVVTQSAPYEYPYVKLNYNEYLEELDYNQLEVGDHIYFGTEDGQTYVAEVMDISGKRPMVRFVAGRNKLIDGEGKLKIQNLLIGMKFRNTLKSTMPVQAMVVLPDMDERMLNYLDEELEIQELEYDTYLDHLYISQLQDGDFIHFATTGVNKSTYILEYNHGVIKVVGGKNQFLQSSGEFVSGKIEKEQHLKMSFATTSPIESNSIKVTKEYIPEGFEDDVELIRNSLEAAKHAAMNPQVTSPRIWIGAPMVTGIHTFFKILKTLKLDSNDLSIEILEAAWSKYQKENPININALPHIRSEEIQKFKKLKREYDRLLGKFERVNEIFED